MSIASGAQYSNKDHLVKRHHKELNLDSPDYDLAEFKYSKLDKSRGADNNKDWYVSILLFLWSCYIRLWKLSQPSSVVFDEVHFGGFASKYINQKFFMDVHPPLAKMMIAWAAQFAGFDGQFPFKAIGDDYLKPKVPYIPIRAFCGLFGVMVVPTAYWTMRSAGFSIPTAVLTAIMICYENGLVTNNRLILLDSILLYFTTFTVLMWVNFRKNQKSPFTTWWWIWLLMTGVGLGATVSCKWVGLLTIASIGLAVLHDLWNVWGDMNNSKCTFFKHFFARAICLIVVPISIYIGLFKVHFDMLPLSGTGTNFMSPEFQTSLVGYKFPEYSQADVVYGAEISIRQDAPRGGYLHSHPHSYPGGSKQQQITSYSHYDNHSIWIIEKVDQTNFTEAEPIKNGDIIRLVHKSTHKRLHTHDVRPMTNEVKYQYEATGYGYEGFKGDNNDNWRIEFLNTTGHEIGADSHLRARDTRFRLISTTQKCALFSRKHKLPDWGFKQMEVTCMKDALRPRSTWMVETSTSSLLPKDTEMVKYRSLSFLEKVFELNKIMWIVNAGLSASHRFASRPKDWPVLKRGISFWTKNHRKVYLLGNPIVFWASTAAVVSYVLLKAILLIMAKRQMNTDYFGGKWGKYDAAAGFLFVSWAMHYFPFNLFGRQLFLHHYMPSLYMAVLLLGVFFEMLTRKFSFKIRWVLVVLCTVAIIHVYRIFMPITYAEPWSTQKCLEATWRPSWDFSCPWYDPKPEKKNVEKTEKKKDEKKKEEKKEEAVQKTSSIADQELAVEIPNVVNNEENQDDVRSNERPNDKADTKGMSSEEKKKVTEQKETSQSKEEKSNENKLSDLD